MLRRGKPSESRLILDVRADETRVYTQMPAPWLVHGFGAAVDRLSDAVRHASPSDARDISIAAFEAAGLLDALSGQEGIAGDVHGSRLRTFLPSQTATATRKARGLTPSI